MGCSSLECSGDRHNDNHRRVRAAVRAAGRLRDVRRVVLSGERMHCQRGHRVLDELCILQLQSYLILCISRFMYNMYRAMITYSTNTSSCSSARFSTRSWQW